MKNLKELSLEELENINNNRSLNALDNRVDFYFGIKSAISLGGYIDFLPWSIMSHDKSQEAFNTGRSNYC